MNRFALLLSLAFCSGMMAVWSLVEAAPQRSQIRLGEKQTVAPVSFDGKELKGAFNDSRDRPRLILVFSPT